ncbi:MAG: hypothetical protein A2504_10680 [Bdellovibrionales bacterium RIFOXYD12_FULL_39_22]|nr:MAG: hypothetical protein A2385_14315 [Bdellovibrionales bacterium RIFOXYB1_FULL_39_21]OFZ40408.1 MAG: hypothetical protein A2485_03005 [Bdellovibrionales bacterium RIFOXYC12_FULL_39_17]OFZ49657.1 MAG: hypothetical protein A2404_09465 [Bdellovibrionales bacterium RIFOXYC1_FULL_39_130]OFZ77327.1 MAG: hypothetical protein A2560_06130 [Bdellovibrionales bacterium RIFOXYD1_FULL_39_84]OFZ95982.1 MAG: hypothetical protein A2504_10680 [Bdellovibrionales bacterium RIFOXYD12_FULL_39_22]HLE11243.1 hy
MLHFNFTKKIDVYFLLSAILLAVLQAGCNSEATTMRRDKQERSSVQIVDAPPAAYPIISELPAEAPAVASADPTATATATPIPIPAKVIISEPLLQLSAASAGVAIASISVSILDANDNPADLASLMGTTIDLQLVHANEAQPSGTTQIIMDGTSHIVVFENFIIQKADVGYKLQASYNSGAIVSAQTTASFNVVAAAPHHITFTQSPPTGVNAKAMDNFSIGVEIRDEFENIVAASSGDSVELILTNNLAGATLSPLTPSALTASGVATISNISLDKKGIGYQLVASATVNSVAISGSSESFNIDYGNPHHLAIYQQPSASTEMGDSMTQPLIIEIQDEGGNRVESHDAIEVTLAFVNDSAGLSLPNDYSNYQISTTDGRASFSNFIVNIPATNYTVKASALLPIIGAVESNVSDSFDILAAPATHLVFTTVPSGYVEKGVNFSVRIEARNDLDMLDTSFAGAVTLSSSVALSSGSTGTTVTAVGGVANFNVNIQTAGAGYALSASCLSPAISTSAPSSTFNVVFASKIVILNPTDVFVTQNATISVEAQSAAGVKDTSFAGTVTLVTDGFASGEGTITLSAGSGSLVITDAIIEVVNLSLANGLETATERALNSSDTKDIAFMEQDECTDADALGTYCGGGRKISGASTGTAPKLVIDIQSNSIYQSRTNAVTTCDNYIDTTQGRSDWRIMTTDAELSAMFNAHLGISGGIGLLVNSTSYKYWANRLTRTNYYRNGYLNGSTITIGETYYTTSNYVRCVRPYSTTIPIDRVEFQPVAGPIYGNVTLELRALDLDGNLYSAFTGDIVIEQSSTSLNITGLGAVHFTGGIGSITINVTDPGEVILNMSDTPIAFNSYRVDTSHTVTFNVLGEVENLAAQINAPTANDISLAWDSSTLGSEDSYLISSAIGSAPPASCTGGTLVPASTIDYDFLRLSGSTAYYFRICWKDNDTGETSTGVVVSATTPYAECIPSDPIGKDCSGGYKIAEGLVVTKTYQAGGTWTTLYSLTAPETNIYADPTPGIVGFNDCDTAINGKTGWRFPTLTEATAICQLGGVGTYTALGFSTNKSIWTSTVASPNVYPGNVEYQVHPITGYPSCSYDGSARGIDGSYYIRCVRDYQP